MSTQTSSNKFSATIEGLDGLAGWLNKQSERTQHAYQTALKIEGFRLRRLMRSEIKKGAPGGQPFKGLSFIAKRMQMKVKSSGSYVRQTPNRKALKTLVTAVKYKILEFPYRIAVGFVDPKGARPARTWRKIALRQQEGFTRIVTKSQRKAFARRGAMLGKIEDGDTPFFLKSSTKTMKTPARPIIAPFWRAHRGSVVANVRSNFKLKMAGKRI